MARLRMPEPGTSLFAPLIHRLALRLDQLPWTEAQESPAEAAHALRSAAALFRADALYTGLDTWLEIEAAGGVVDRDEYGAVLALRRPAQAFRAAQVLDSPQVRGALALNRYLIAPESSGPAVIAGLSSPATVLSRLGLSAPSTEHREQAFQVAAGLAGSYLEAGSAALILLRETASDWETDARAVASLRNLADYYAVPLLVLSRTPLPGDGAAVAGVLAFGQEDGELPVGPCQIAPWLRISTREVDADVDPATIHGWRT